MRAVIRDGRRVPGGCSSGGVLIAKVGLFPRTAGPRYGADRDVGQTEMRDKDMERTNGADNMDNMERTEI